MSPAPRTAIGIDLGSRLTKIVRVEGGRIADALVFDTGHDPLARLPAMLKGLQADAVVATGYGRHLVKGSLPCSAVTEIRACARAARQLAPEAESVIDVGGQDTKAIEVGPRGFGRFEMNDRCAAGTGRFLEVMAAALGYRLEDFGAEALLADRPVQVTSMCTVFAESEVVSLIAKGEGRRRIALGLHVATARRVAAMASRVRLGRRTLFVGGVARNPCMVAALRDELPCDLAAPERPELAVALGAALIGLEEPAAH
ncbi:MAG: 3-hydroxyacyl-ACP dehydratase [Planctomycetes bacterium]|nr:3-hydroxyacyl-ACP dehydratase [Planctomycetota bacterium]